MTANVNINITANTKQATQNVSSFATKWTELYSKFQLVKQGAEIVAGVFKTAFDLAQEGAAIERTASKLDNLAVSIGTTAEALLTDLRTATRGMLSDAEIMESATQIISLGLANTGEGVVRLATLVSELGWDMQQVILTFANNSKMRLDALGLSVTDVEQRAKALEEQGYSMDEAFDLAVIEAGEAKLLLLGSAADTSAGAWKRMQAEIDNAKDSLALFLSKGLTPYISGTYASQDAIKAQIEAAYQQNLTWEEFLDTLGVMKPMMEGLNLVTLGGAQAKYEDAAATQNQEQETQRLLAAVTAVTDKYIPYQENMFYAQQAMDMLNTSTETHTGTLYALQTALGGVGDELDFTKDATSLLNDALKSQADTTADLNLRQIELLYVTGQITEAEREELIAKNEQIQKLQKLNQLLESGKVTWEQYLAIVADGKVTMEEMAGAVADTWGEFLDMNLESDIQMFEDMDEAAGILNETLAETLAPASEATTSLNNLAMAAELAGENAFNAIGAVNDFGTALDETAGDYPVNIHVTVTGDPIPNLGGYGGGAPTGPTIPTAGLMAGGGNVPTQAGGIGGGRGDDWRAGLSNAEIAEIGALMGGGYGLAYAYELVTGRPLGQKGKTGFSGFPGGRTAPLPMGDPFGNPTGTVGGAPMPSPTGTTGGAPMPGGWNMAGNGTTIVVLLDGQQIAARVQTYAGQSFRTASVSGAGIIGN